MFGAAWEAFPAAADTHATYLLLLLEPVHLCSPALLYPAGLANIQQEAVGTGVSSSLFTIFLVSQTPMSIFRTFLLLGPVTKPLSILSIHPSICPFICLSTHPSIYPFIHSSIHPSIYIHPSIH